MSLLQHLTEFSMLQTIDSYKGSVLVLVGSPTTAFSVLMMCIQPKSSTFSRNKQSTGKSFCALKLETFQIVIGVALLALICNPKNFDDDRLDDEEQIINYLDDIENGNIPKWR